MMLLLSVGLMRSAIGERLHLVQVFDWPKATFAS